jgi:hypothetical protein
MVLAEGRMAGNDTGSAKAFGTLATVLGVALMFFGAVETRNQQEREDRQRDQREAHEADIRAGRVQREPTMSELMERQRAEEESRQRAAQAERERAAQLEAERGESKPGERR